MILYLQDILKLKFIKLSLVILTKQNFYYIYVNLDNSTFKL